MVRTARVYEVMADIVRFPVPTRPPPPSTSLLGRTATAPQGGEYRLQPDGLWFVKGDYELPITNVRAVIERRITRGADVRLGLRVELADQVHEVEVPTARLDACKWVSQVPGATIWPGAGTRQHLLTALALMSSPEAAVVYDHIGWVRSDDGRWTYLHAGGSIRGGDVRVEVDEPLDKFVLPDRPGRPEAVLDLLDLASDRVMMALIAAIARAAVGGCVRFGTMLHGTTGGGKSVTAAIVQSFWGTPELPGSWSSTANANEVLAHDAKDALVVIDDWVPGQTAQGSEVVLDRILRAAGNGLGRARMGSVGKAPRGMILSTGEALPRLPSLLARMITLRLDAGDLDWGRLTVLQRRGRDGEYAAWTTAFVSWCAPRLDELRDRLDRDAQRLRQHFARFEVHARTVDALSHLAAAWLILIDFLIDAGAVSVEDGRGLVRRAQAALDEVAQEQARVQLSGDPARLFLTVLGQLVSAGDVRITDDTTKVPGAGEPPAVGWRRRRDLYLDPTTAMAAVQRALGDQRGLDLSDRALGRALREAGALTRIDPRGGVVRYVVRARLGGERRSVWALRPEALGIGEAEDFGPTGGHWAKGDADQKGSPLDDLGGER